MTDFEDIIKYFSDEEVSKFEDFYPMSEEQVRDIITEWKDMDNRLVAELKSKQNVIGSIGYWIDNEGHYCIDYDFNPEYCGQGYATEAGNALVRYLFESVGISTVYGDCDVQNVSSWKLLERLGFSRIAGEFYCSIFIWYLAHCNADQKLCEWRNVICGNASDGHRLYYPCRNYGNQMGASLPHYGKSVGRAWRPFVQ